MAGLYPDPPAERMAYDLDGTVGFLLAPAMGIADVSTLATAQLAAINDENPSDGITLPNWAGSGWIGLIFPQLRDITAMYMAVTGYNGYGNPQCSTDTTTGQDGTWLNGMGVGGQPTIIAATTAIPTTEWRSQTGSGWKGGLLNNTGIKAVRWQLATNNATTVLSMWHLYGGLTSGQTPDRLRFWHPTLDQPLSTTPALLDFGNLSRGQTYTKTFRVKNNSATLNANAPVVSMSAPTDSGGAQLSEMALSLDGTTWSSTLTLSGLAPGAISPVITLRRVKSSTSPLGPWAQRLRAVAASWA